MSRVLILGNAGSGKSTLAARLGAETGAPVLDLDTLVWVPGRMAEPRPPEAVRADLRAFSKRQAAWIIEGCYGDLANVVLDGRTELILLDPGEETCVANCRRRPWEPHKYASKEEQDARLDYLLAWVREYYHRDGPMSLRAHRALYDAYAGPKRRLP
jgi:adenylate kinase family enzyme